MTLFLSLTRTIKRSRIRITRNIKTFKEAFEHKYRTKEALALEKCLEIELDKKYYCFNMHLKAQEVSRRSIYKTPMVGHLLDEKKHYHR